MASTSLQLTPGTAPLRYAALPSTEPSAVPPPRVQLPNPLTRLVGREDELASLRELLRSTRLLTLKGVGGSGKTRLAVALAREAAHTSEDGVVWTDLAALGDPELLPRQIAAALGVREPSDRSALDAVARALSLRPRLLVLDNCEHQVAACAAIAERLLSECPRLTVLATSRESLGVPGEVAWTVPPLRVPPAHVESSAEAVGSSEAVQLFVDRARAVLPGFDLDEGNVRAVARICRQLDGIPLAVELAAARVQVLSPEQIVHRLDDVLRLLTSGPRTAASRHRTLRATIDWSYQLLTEQERLLFARLSVFPEGFTLEAVEEICADARIRPDEVLDLLASVVGKSLVSLDDRGSTVRYRLLESIRQFAAERLRERGEESALRRRHASHFLALAEQAEPRLVDADCAWVARIAADYPNLRGALTWSFGPEGDPALGVAMVAALRWFWYYAVRWSEGQGWFEKALGATTAEAATRERAGILHVAGTISWYQGDSPTARGQLEESERLWRAIGDDRQLALALGSLAQVLACPEGAQRPTGAEFGAGRAQQVANEALHLVRRSGAARSTAYILANSTAFVAANRGDLRAAEEALAEAEQIWRELDDPRGVALARTQQARMALRRGDLPRAEALVRDAPPTRGDTLDEWFESRSLRILGYVALARGAAGDAARLLGASGALLARLGAEPAREERAEFEAAVATVRAGLGEDAFARAWAEGGRTTLEDAVAQLSSAGGQVTAPRLDDGPTARATAPALPLYLDKPPAGAASVATLGVNALGPLQIFRHGVALEPDAWGPAKPRELLLYLLCHPDGCTKEQIGLALWPDASPVQLRNNFHTALHRIRRALGEGDWIALAGDRYRIGPEIRYEFDVAAFDAEASAALGALRAGGGDIGALQRALERYRGHFLEGEVVGDWHLEIRDRLRRLHLDGLRWLADHCLREGSYRDAAAHFRRVVYLDQLDEAAYRGLMVCHARLGERTHALRLYRQLLELLSAELDVGPEEETSDLFARLQRGEPV